jgi:hypothetical protein
MFGTGAVHEKLLQISKGSIWSFDSWPSFTAFLQHWKHCSSTFAPLIHRLSLQHFYSNFYITGNTAAARLLLWFTGLVYSISTAISTSLETLQHHVWPSWLQWLSSWGRRIQRRQCPVNWVCRFLCWKALDHCSQNSQVIKLSTISTKKAPLNLRSSSTNKYMFLLFDMVCRCKRRKQTMTGNRWKL